MLSLRLSRKLKFSLTLWAREPIEGWWAHARFFGISQFLCLFFPLSLLPSSSPSLSFFPFLPSSSSLPLPSLPSSSPSLSLLLSFSLPSLSVSFPLTPCPCPYLFLPLFHPVSLSPFVSVSLSPSLSLFVSVLLSESLRFSRFHFLSFHPCVDAALPGVIQRRVAALISSDATLQRHSLLLRV